MSAKNKLTINHEAIKALSKSPAVVADLERRAKKIASAAGGEAIGYKVTHLALEDPRGAVSVMATGHAASHNRKHNSLVRNLDAGR